MEALLTVLLIVWILGWVAYCLTEIAGVDVRSALVELAPHLTWLVPAALVAAWVARRRVLAADSFAPGDHVIYLKQKYSTIPGPRAEQVHPAPHGDGYSYLVRKPWTVADVVDPGTLEIVTNGGKRHRISADDPRLHKAGLIEELKLRLLWKKTFPKLAA